MQKDIGKIVLSSEKEKRELERIRRWHVHIDDIYITAYDMFDAFVQFTVGGDYKVEIFDIPRKNKKMKKVSGKRGYTDCTEVVENLKVECREKFDKTINTEIRDSIVNLMRQHLSIEVWDYNAFKLNEFQGISMIELMKIIKGNIFQSVLIEKKIGSNKKPICKVEFKIIFQEIWDFKLTFEDWGARNVNYLFSYTDISDIAPGLEFNLNNDSKQVIRSQGNKVGVE
jgi:hypothetical protein